MDKKPEISTSLEILHVGSPNDAVWVAVLRDALAPIGQLTSISMPDISLHVQQTHYDLIIIDASTLNEVEDLVATLHEQQPQIPIVVMTTSPTWQRARRMLLAGATDYIRKSLDKDAILISFWEIFKKSATTDPDMEKKDVSSKDSISRQ